MMVVEVGIDMVMKIISKGGDNDDNDNNLFEAFR